MINKPVLVSVALSFVLAACGSNTAETTTTADAPTSIAETTTTHGSTDISPTSDTTSTTAPETTTTVAVRDMIEIDIRYVSGSVEGGGRIEIPLGEPVVITIESDVADEGHLHGYDIFVDLEPGSPASIEFVADIPGIFELELEGTGVLLADLEVAP